MVFIALLLLNKNLLFELSTQLLFYIKNSFKIALKHWAKDIKSMMEGLDLEHEGREHSGIDQWARIWSKSSKVYAAEVKLLKIIYQKESNEQL